MTRENREALLQTAPEILLETARTYRLQAAEAREEGRFLPIQDGHEASRCFSDARELDRAADMLEAISRVFRQRAELSDHYLLPRAYARAVHHAHA